MIEELKPCPFCGSKLIKAVRGITRSDIIFFKCGNPDCGAVVSFDNTKCLLLPENAFNDWNRRADNDKG